jgi:hypothetical protein
MTPLKRVRAAQYTVPAAPGAALGEVGRVSGETIVKVTVDVSGKMIQDTEEEVKAFAKAQRARQ